MTAPDTPDPDALVDEFMSRARPSSSDEYEAKVLAAQLFRPTPIQLLPQDAARTLAMMKLNLQGWSPQIEDRAHADIRIGEYAIFDIRSENGRWGEIRVAQLCQVHEDGSLTLASDRWHFQNPKNHGGSIGRYSTFWADTIPAERIMGIEPVPYSVRPGDLVFAADKSGAFLLAEKIGKITLEGLVGFYKAYDDHNSPDWSAPDQGTVVRWEDIVDLQIIIRGSE